MTQRALLTGATGFVGSHLARRLVSDGWKVHLLTRADSQLGQLQEAADLVTVHRIRDPGNGHEVADAIDAALDAADPDVTFSLATSRPAQTLRKVADIFDANVRLPSLLAAGLAARGGGLLLTTASYMLHRGGTAPSVHSASCGCVDPVLAWAAAYKGLTWATLSIASAYGPGDRRAKLLSVLVAAALSGEPVDLVYPGRVLDMVHVDDIVAAWLAVAEGLASGEVASGTRHDVSSGQQITLKDLVALLESVVDRPIVARWNARPTRPSDRVNPLTEPSWVPGWQPKVKLPAGLRSVVSDRLAMLAIQ